MCGNVNVKTYKVASLLEILHVATLVHDDVVDESDLRRRLAICWKDMEK